MSPVVVALFGVCAVTLVALAGVIVAMRRLGAGASALTAAVDRLAEQVTELARAESARVSAAAGRAEQADWVITFDEEAEREGRSSGAGNAARNGSRATRTRARNSAARAARDGAPTAEEPTVSTQQVVSTTLGEPMIKVAAFSHGVRQALREERRAHLAYQVRREYRRRRRESRARVRAAQRAGTPR